jgi:hypothetical protein
MLILACGVLAVLSPALFGGDLRRLAHVQLRLIWLPVVALLAQILIIEIIPDGNRAFLEVVHLATYGLAAAFVAANWRIPGLLIVAVGGALNGITIALNSGTLPASLHALRAAGFHTEDGEFINSGVLSDPVLPLLGDIFVWPAPLPLSNVYSFGDILIIFGAAYGAHRIAGSRLVKRPWFPEGMEPAGLPEVQGAGQVAGPVRQPGLAPEDSLSSLQRRLLELQPPAASAQE